MPEEYIPAEQAAGLWRSVMMIIGKKPNLEREGPFFVPNEARCLNEQVLPWLKRRGCSQFSAHQVFMSEEAYRSIPPVPPEETSVEDMLGYSVAGRHAKNFQDDTPYP